MKVMWEMIIQERRGDRDSTCSDYKRGDLENRAYVRQKYVKEVIEIRDIIIRMKKERSEKYGVKYILFEDEFWLKTKRDNSK